MKNYSDELSSITKDLMFKEPHYGLFLIMLNKRWTLDVPTAAVGLNGMNYELLLNPNFWDSCTREQKTELIKHELLHIGYFHLTEFSHLTDREIAGIAFDLEVNQYLDEKNLPHGRLLPDKFPELNLELRKGSTYYYGKLSEAKKNGNSPNLNSLLGQLATNQPGQPCDLGGDQVITGTHEDLNKPLTELEKKMIDNQVNRLVEEIREQTKNIGSMPGFFEEMLKRLPILLPPKFDWRGYFKRFIEGTGDVYTKKSRSKESTRFPDNPGLRIKRKCSPLIAIDTSGSVSKEELKEFFNEIEYVHKTGVKVTIIQCDTVIQKIEPYKPGYEMTIKGRGGTDFQPVIDYYNEHQHLYTSLVYLTDGEASTPTKALGKMLWVFSSKSKINEDLIGQKIKLN